MSSTDRIGGPSRVPPDVKAFGRHPLQPEESPTGFAMRQGDVFRDQSTNAMVVTQMPA
jgi:hypothetical protein